MAKRTEKPKTFAAVALASVVPFGREPRTSRGAQALGKREERAAGPTEEQSGTIAEPPLRSFAQRRSDRKKKEQTAQALGIFSTYRGAFHPSPPPRSTPTPTQEARAEKPAKKLSCARAYNTEFLFFAFTHRQ